jgi:ABC-type multidrug transport system permease subunit
MDEQEKIKNTKMEAFFPKIFCVLTCLIGCLVLIAAPFYVPLVSILKFVGTMATSAVLALLFGIVSVSGLNFAAKDAERKESSLTFLAMLYLTSLSLGFVALLSFLRILVWSFDHFFNVHISWFLVPAQ